MDGATTHRDWTPIDAMSTEFDISDLAENYIAAPCEGRREALTALID